MNNIIIRAIVLILIIVGHWLIGNFLVGYDEVSYALTYVAAIVGGAVFGLGAAHKIPTYRLNIVVRNCIKIGSVCHYERDEVIY